MRGKLVLACLVLVACMCPHSIALANGSAGVSITAEGQQISISILPDTYDFGPVTEGGTYETSLSVFTLTNDSNVAIDTTIQGANAKGSGDYEWILSNYANPGADIYGLKAGLEGGYFNIIVKKDSPYNPLVDGLASGYSQGFGLQLSAPTEIASSEQVSATVTVTAVIA